MAAKKKEWKGLTITRSREAFIGPLCSCGNNEYKRVEITVKSFLHPNQRVKSLTFECTNAQCHRRTPFGRVTEKEDAANGKEAATTVPSSRSLFTSQFRPLHERNHAR